ncbi:MAG: 1-acyl-sn-glycerol-3-phosphate acyltransferase [Bacteroidales bacterium]|nr:1-acyl-sn-glycerol-3-phosphate acyltransferase [Bacteroidales bacterium]
MSSLQDHHPVSDAEIPSLMTKIMSDPLFSSVARYIYPDKALDEVKAFLSQIRTVRELQGKVMRVNLGRILSASHSSYTYHFSPEVKKGQPYLFVSNHRDITLDAMLLQCALYDEGFETSQIVFGTNLLAIPLMEWVGRANKMVGIERGGNPKEFFQCLSYLSGFLRSTIVGRRESVWIAQGNGRTKDGNDTTAPAIIKMFGISSDKPLSEAVAELNPVPVSVSYEIEPCDEMKAIELAKTRGEGHYEKSADEDYMSALSGITKEKGRIHIEVGSPLTAQQLEACHDDANRIAALFDDAIRGNYHLHPSNYVAYDFKHGTTSFSDHYSASEKDRFLLRALSFKDKVNNPDVALSNDERILAKQIFLDIYATPIENKYGHLH